MNPYISIIIPAYNEEDKIKDTLENIKDINEINEILVIDDGSSDKTTEIANSIEPKPHRSATLRARAAISAVCELGIPPAAVIFLKLNFLSLYQ